MSIAGTCGSCLMGNHGGHNYGYRLAEGLIGGQYCDCSGDCHSRWEEALKEFGEEWGT